MHTFPTGIIIHINEEDVINYDEKTGLMTLPFKENIGKVLDGQDRIAGLENFGINI